MIKCIFALVLVFWIMAIALIIIFLKKYNVVYARCIDAENCLGLTKENGYQFFEYEKDDYKGEKIFGKAITVGKVKVGNTYKILATREYNERVILFSDVVRLLVVLSVFSVLMLFLYIYIANRAALF